MDVTTDSYWERPDGIRSDSFTERIDNETTGLYRFPKLQRDIKYVNYD
jgi:hypothetical protein